MVAVSLRLPAELYTAIKLMAANQDRSLNRQIIYLLRLGLRETLDSDDSGYTLPTPKP
jgi:hypothetical protein